VAPAAVDRYLLPAWRSAANPPVVERWGRQTDGRTLDRYVKRCSAHYAGSVSKISAAAAAAAAVVFGCAYPALPSDMHIAATSVDTVRIQCNGTDESWTLSCVADTWVGLIGNCTVSE